MARKMGITQTGEVPSRHFQKWQILMIALTVFAVLAGGTVFGLSQTVWKTPTLPVPPLQEGIAPVEPTPTPTPTPTTPTLVQKEKVLDATKHGLILWGSGRNGLAYGLGSMFTPPGNTSPGTFPPYEFPLFVTRPDQTPTKILAVISDPNINEIGGVWESDIIKDPEHEEFILKVRLTRVDEPYKYRTKLLFSPYSDGRAWMSVESPPR